MVKSFPVKPDLNNTAIPYIPVLSIQGFSVAQMVKNLPAFNAGNPGFVPGSRRSPGEGMATHSSILAWRIPWTEEPGGLQSLGWERVGHN